MNEAWIQKCFDDDPTNPQWAIALGLYAIASAIRESNLHQVAEALDNLNGLVLAVENLNLKSND